MKNKTSKIILFAVLSFSLSSCSMKDVVNFVEKLNAKVEEIINKESESVSIIESESTSVVSQYVVNCYFETNLLGTFNVNANTPIDITENPLESNPKYTFLGWDANNDNIAEVFPYTINKDTDFKALYSINQYTYSIYVKDKLVKSVTANYDSDIEYPTIDSEIVGDDVFFFKGWKYDGVYDGNTYLKVTKDVRIDACYETSQIVKMYYNNTLYALLVNENDTITFLDSFGITASKGKEIKWYLDSGYNSLLESNKMIKGNLTIYGKEEYINASDAGILMSSKDNLVDYVNIMVLNREESQKFQIGFEYDNFNNLVSYISDNVDPVYSYQMNSSLLNDELTLTFAYNKAATTTSSEIYYSQINSYGYEEKANLRSQTYDDFKINNSSTQFNVKTSEALFYALEHGYKPIINSDNTSLNNLYEKMKVILRNIISDDMDDVSKAKAIYEYLIMNVTYDGKTMDEFTTLSSQELTKKKAFFLEGVFDDNLAVCDGISKAYACLLQIEGIECVRVTGQTISGTNHAWNKIKINDKWYVVDVTSGGSIVSEDEILTYSFFMISDSKYSSHAISDNKYYSSIVCNEDYDIYQLLNRKANNTNEAASLLTNYLTNASSGKSSFNIKLNYSYDSLKDEIENILDKISISCSISYIDSFSSLVFIYDK